MYSEESDEESTPMECEDENSEYECEEDESDGEEVDPANAQKGQNKVEDSDGRKTCIVCGIRDGAVMIHYALQSCKHVFCRRCIVKYVISNPKLEAVLVYGEKFHGLNCPVHGCSKFLTRQDIRAIAGHQVLHFLDTHVLEQLFESGRRPGKALQAVCEALSDLKFTFDKFTVVGKKQKGEVDNVLGENLKAITDGVSSALMENTYLLEVVFCCYPTLSTVLTWLLRNDSTMDISERAILYLQMLGFMKMVIGKPELYPMLHKTEGNTDCWMLDLVAMEQKSVMYMFEKLHKQATFILEKNLLSGNDIEITLLSESKNVYEELEEDVRVWRAEIALHPWFRDAHEFFTRKWPGGLPIESSGSSCVIASRSEKEKMEYVLTLKPMQFGQAALREIHYFRNELTGMHVVNPGRAKRIAKEIATLATNMPLEYHSSVHIRVDEQRLDMLRALILGPEGTPYENGVFLFDIMLPEDYPNSSPKVQFLTTAGGTVRFNPNLYSSGKVCLSLLGTWDGPSWEPGVSTVLQVLVSIQSLVLVQQPYYNEPDQRVNKEACEMYSVEQMYNTLVYSMLPAMREPSPAFEDLIHAHFKTKRKVIEEQCERWKTEMLPPFMSTQEGARGREGVNVSMKEAAESVKRELAIRFG